MKTNNIAFTFASAEVNKIGDLIKITKYLRQKTCPLDSNIR